MGDNHLALLAEKGIGLTVVVYPWPDQIERGQEVGLAVLPGPF